MITARLLIGGHDVEAQDGRLFEVVSELPMNASGKVQKFVLKEKALAGA